MGENGNNDKDKKPIVNFAFLISEVEGRYEIRVQNEGIPSSEVILILETWLEEYKENYKKKFREGNWK